MPPESPDNATATVAGCIGVALGLLDEWLSGHDPQAPGGLGPHVALPAGHWAGERAATDILALARKARAFRSLDTLLIRQGGKHVLYGSALARRSRHPNVVTHQRHTRARADTHRHSLNPATIPSHQQSLRCDDHWNPPRHRGAK